MFDDFLKCESNNLQLVWHSSESENHNGIVVVKIYISLLDIDLILSGGHEFF